MRQRVAAGLQRLLSPDTRAKDLNQGDAMKKTLGIAAVLLGLVAFDTRGAAQQTPDWGARGGQQ